MMAAPPAASTMLAQSFAVTILVIACTSGRFSAHAADRCQDRVGQCSAPLIWLSTCVRPSAASTSTEIAAPTAVDSRKLGTKVKSAAEALFISSAATG